MSLQTLYQRVQRSFRIKHRRSLTGPFVRIPQLTGQSCLIGQERFRFSGTLIERLRTFLWCRPKIPKIPNHVGFWTFRNFGVQDFDYSGFRSIRDLELFGISTHTGFKFICDFEQFGVMGFGICPIRNFNVRDFGSLGISRFWPFRD